eukprot:scaffold107005_cov43-Prasinocladus_malaysianus.AAC.2
MRTAIAAIALNANKAPMRCIVQPEASRPFKVLLGRQSRRHGMKQHMTGAKMHPSRKASHCRGAGQESVASAWRWQRQEPPFSTAAFDDK